VIVRNIRIDADRPADQFRRRVEPSHLKRQRPQQMQRIRMIRLGRKNLR